MSQSSTDNFEIRAETRRTKVFYRGKYVTAFNDCTWRPYIYPLCSPSGACMLHEASVDHPFHNGIFFGHRAIDTHGDALPLDCWVPLYSPLYTFCSGRIICRKRDWKTMAENTIRFSEQSEWLDQLSTPILTQQTQYEIQCGDSVNSIRIQTTMTACSRITLNQIKEALLCVRIADPFCPHNGGTMVDSAGHLGEENIIDTTSEWVDFQGRRGAETFGLLVHQPFGREPIPWFVRDYGLAGINDFRHGPLEMTEGRQYKLNSLVAAHDADHNNPELIALVNTCHSDNA